MDKLKTMMMKSFALSLCFGILAVAADLPRQSPEFTLNMPGGKQELLSKSRGKVVLVEFLFTTCPHCQHTAGIISKLQADYGAKGFQAYGVAFNEMAQMLVADFQRDFGAKFPVAYSNREPVLQFLSISPMERFVVPQVVLIDKKGMIRAQSPPLGDPKMQEEASLRMQIEALLKEGGSTAAPSVAKKK